MDEKVKNLTEILNVSKETAKLLLKKYHNNVQVCIERYFSNPEEASSTGVVATIPFDNENDSDNNISQLLEDEEIPDLVSATTDDFIGDNTAESSLIAKSSKDAFFRDFNGEDSFLPSFQIQKAEKENENEDDTFEIDEDILQLQSEDKDLPKGIKNVGNTCFFSCLVQVYFHIKQFSNSIIGDTTLWDGTLKKKSKEDYLKNHHAKDPKTQKEIDEKVEKISRHLDLLKELQKLFAFLHLSEKKYLDPSKLMKLVKEEKIINSIGIQEDIFEINENFLTFLESVNPALKRFTKRMFYGQYLTTFDALEEDKTPYHLEKESEYSHFHLFISNEVNKLCDAIEKYTEIEKISFTTPKGFTTKANQQIWIKNVPPILFTRLGRIQFDKKNQTATKKRIPFYFEKDLYLDRFLYSNKEEVTKRRKIIEEDKSKILILKQQLDELNQELLVFEGDFKKTPKIQGNELIDNTINFLKGLKQFKIMNLDEMCKNLSVISKKLQEKIGEIKKEIRMLQKKIDSTFSDMKKKHYKLHSIIFHDGSSTQVGHYFVVINTHKNEWIKFNDNWVSRIDEKKFFKEVQESSMTSCYSLIYVDANMPVGKLCDIPKPIKDFVGKDNLKFREKIIKFIENEKREIISEKKRFVKLFKEQWNKKKEDASDFIYFKDHINKQLIQDIKLDKRIISFSFFLLLLKQINHSKFELAKELYEKKIERKKEIKFGELLRETMKDDEDFMLPTTEEIEENMKIFSLFLNLNYSFYWGLKYMSESNYIQALDYFKIALSQNDQLGNKTIDIFDELATYMLTIAYTSYVEGIQLMKSDRINCLEYFEWFFMIYPLIKCKRIDKFVQDKIVGEYFEETHRIVKHGRFIHHRFNKEECQQLNKFSKKMFDLHLSILDEKNKKREIQKVNKEISYGSFEKIVLAKEIKEVRQKIGKNYFYNIRDIQNPEPESKYFYGNFEKTTSNYQKLLNAFEEVKDNHDPFHTSNFRYFTE